jgi:hypothetical protein
MLATAWVITVVIAALSIQPVLNILSPRQIMNTSFDPLDLVNTYGAFGWVGKERLNVVFEGTMDDVPDDKRAGDPIIKGFPVDPGQRSAGAYPASLDWQMWFAAMSNADSIMDSEPVSKLLTTSRRCWSVAVILSPINRHFIGQCCITTALRCLRFQGLW